MAVNKGGDNERTPQGDRSLGVPENTPMAPKKAPSRPLIPRFRLGGSSQVMERARDVDGGCNREQEALERVELEEIFDEDENEGDSRSRTLGSQSYSKTGSVGNEELLELVKAQGETIKWLER